MLRSSRRFRLLLAAVAATALLALPAAAQAAPIIATQVTVAPQVEANGLNAVTVTIINNGDAAAVAGTVTLGADGFMQVEGPVVKGGTGAAFITVAPGSAVITAGALPAGNVATATFQVRTAKKHDAYLSFRAVGSGGSYNPNSATSAWADTVNVKGGPSRIIRTFGPISPAGGAGITDQWITKGAAATANVTVTNRGEGAAHYVVVRVYTSTSTDRLFSPLHLPENPNDVRFTFAGGTPCVPIGPENVTCEIETLAPGATVTVPVSTLATTHYGSLSGSVNTDAKADGGSDYSAWLGNEYVSNDEYSESVAVTDGTTASTTVEFDGPRVAATNTPVTYRGSLANGGPDTLVNGVLRVSADTFFASGERSNDVPLGAPDSIPSIQSLQTDFGATCVRATEQWDDGGTWETRELADTYDCPVASLTPGTRVGFTAVARWATSRVANQFTNYELRANIDAELLSRAYDDGEYYDGVSTNFSPTTYGDVEVTVQSPALIGAERVAMQKVTITNRGTDHARYLDFTARVFNGGTFEPSLASARCTGTVVTTRATCSVPDLAPGASRTFEFPVKAGKALGTLATYYEVEADSYEPNVEDNQVGHSMTVVAANQIPLLGVVVGKPKATPIAAIAKTGLKTQVTTPGAAQVKVDLVVTPAVAKALGLTKAPKPKQPVKGKAKVVVPKDVVIGTSVVTTTKAGTVVVTVKLSKKYAKRLLAAKGKFAAKRIVTVVSTERFQEGATSLTTSAMTITPAKATKPKPKPKPKPGKQG